MKLNVQKLTSPVEVGLGFLKKRNANAIYFETRWGVHTFFMKRPITVLVLDGKNIIVAKKMLLPWRIFLWNPQYKRVVEISKRGKRFKCAVGQKVTLITRYE